MLRSLLTNTLQEPGKGFSLLIELTTDILQNPATGNAFLLIASLVGVGGSYWLYRKQKRDSQVKLKRALAAEIGQMEQIPETANNLRNLSTEPPESKLAASSVPPADSFPTMIYEENASRLGSLVEEELDEVIDFYTRLLQHKAIIQSIREDPQTVPMPDHERIVEEFPDLEEDRESLMCKLGFGDTLN